MKVLVTNAASKTAFTFLPMLCNGDVFGQQQKLHLVLFAFKPLIHEVEVLANDLLECCFPVLEKIETTSDMKKAFQGIDIAILSELERNVIGFKTNSILFRAYGLLLNVQANKDVKVLVCGRTANTSTFICSSFAPSISPNNFTALAQSVRCYLKAAMNPASIRALQGQSESSVHPSTDLDAMIGDEEDILVWGSCSHPVVSVIDKNGHLHIKDIKMGPKNPGCLVTAKAMAEHLGYWLGKEKQNTRTLNSSKSIFCMGVVTNGNHLGIENNLYFNLPINLARRNSNPLEYSLLFRTDDHLLSALKEASDVLSKERDSAIVDCWRVVLPHSHM